MRSNHTPKTTAALRYAPVGCARRVKSAGFACDSSPADALYKTLSEITYSGGDF